MLLLWTSRRAD